jgi:mannan endo-1,4-beta-mannosidase
VSGSLAAWALAALCVVAAPCSLHPSASRAQVAVGSEGASTLSREEASIVAPPGAPPGSFVRVEGDRFVVGGRPFRFVGANASVMHGPRHRAALEATLDAVAADGLSVVRVWALGEQPADAEPWARDYAFRVGADGWVDSSFAHLDRVLAAAAARDLRVIVVLANRWADYGGAPRYLEWAGLPVPRELSGAPSIFGLPAFFEDTRARALYREHLERVVGHRSALTGIPYRDDPTILAWELINESDVAPRSRGTLLEWTGEMAARAHALDASHLVAAGHIGYSSSAQRQTWLAVQRLPGIDYADAHAYPTQYERVRSLAELDAFVDDHVQLAHHVAGKPFVWGELGFATTTRRHRGLPRTRWLERFLARSELDRADGALVWTYATAAERPHEHGIDVDGPEVTRTADVRRVLARFARRWRREASARSPHLGPARGERPLWSTRRTIRGGVRAHAPTLGREGARWLVAPESFARLEGESAGRWGGAAIAHVYASGTGEIVYRLLASPRSARLARGRARIRVRVRASSELPGAGLAAAGIGAGPDDASEISVLLDGHELGRVVVPPDDGVGAWVEVVSEDARALAVLARPGPHELRIRAPEGPRANGLCLYGAATGASPLPGAVGELPGRVEVLLETAR